MAEDVEKRLQKRVLKLEKALLRLRERCVIHHRKVHEQSAFPPGLVAEHTYGDMAMVADEDEDVMLEIDQALMED